MSPVPADADSDSLDPLSLALRGLADATARVNTHASKEDLTAAAIATGEALLWLAAAHDLLDRPPVPLLDALRYARDRVAHQAAYTADLITHGFGTAPFGTSPFGGGMRLEWRSRGDLPVPPARHRRADRESAYDTLLAGRPIVDRLLDAAATLRSHIPQQK